MAFTVTSNSFKDGDYLGKDFILSADFGFGCAGGITHQEDNHIVAFVQALQVRGQPEPVVDALGAVGRVVEDEQGGHVSDLLSSWPGPAPRRTQ